VTIDGVKIKLQVWDTAGQERFRTITRAYYRGAHGIMLVYDVTDSKSFGNIRNWMRNIEQHASSSVNKVLVGNKCDMADKRMIATEKGQALADEYGIKFFETSAKTGYNVEDSFMALAKEVKHRVVDAPHIKKETKKLKQQGTLNLTSTRAHSTGHNGEKKSGCPCASSSS